MRILVTGGAGYIGSHCVRSLLISGHQPIVIDNLSNGNENIVKDKLKVPFIISNVGNKKILNEIIHGTHPSLQNTIHENKLIEGVIHFAAFAYVEESMKNPLIYYKNNVMESIVLLESICNQACIKKRKDNSPIPIIFSSSCSTYGIPIKNPITEDSVQNPITPYGKSKLIIENLLKDLSVSCGLKSLIFRYFNAAGASEDGLIGELHNPETHLIPLVIKAALGIKKNIEIFGNDFPTFDGTCVRDYIHVVDIADAHVLGLNFFNENLSKDKFKIYNLGNEKGFSVLEIIKCVEKITNKNVPYTTIKRREGDPAELIASSKKFRQEFNWQPKYKDINVIIRHAYKWIKTIDDF